METLPDWLTWSLAGLTGYLVGAVPFGLVLTRAAGIDLRKTGSGNIGATNVLRTGRRDLALATLLLDSLKAGLVALAFSGFAGRDIGLLAGAMAFAGHCYPVWLGFRGGKGVATYAGLLVFITWKGLAFAAPAWLGVFALSRISSLAALAGAVAAPLGALMLGEDRNVVIVLGLLSVLVFWSHRANIARLMRGEEPRFGAREAGR